MRLVAWTLMLAYGNHCYSCQSPVRQLIPASHMSRSSSKAALRVQTLVLPHQGPQSFSEWRTRTLLFLSAGRHHSDELHAAANKSALAALPASAFKVQHRLLTGRDRNCMPSHVTHVLAVNWWIINCKTPRHISDRPQWRVIIYEGKDKKTQVSVGKWPNVCVWTKMLLYFIMLSPPDSYCPVITG